MNKVGLAVFSTLTVFFSTRVEKNGVGADRDTNQGPIGGSGPDPAFFHPRPARGRPDTVPVAGVISDRARVEKKQGQGGKNRVRVALDRARVEKNRVGVEFNRGRGERNSVRVEKKQGEGGKNRLGEGGKKQGSGWKKQG